MTNVQILKKAIEKAIKNGWDKNNKSYWKNIASSKELLELYVSENAYFSLIFSHDFAKAFWGEEDAQIEVGEKKLIGANVPNWMWHIQQMVREKDPIKYLEKFI